MVADSYTDGGRLFVVGDLRLRIRSYKGISEMRKS
jgi:hypothetical protein